MRAPVDVRYLKWPDRPHWEATLERLGEDDHGVWLGARPGAAYARAGEPGKPFEHSFVLLIPRGGWWTFIRNDSFRSIELYFDVTLPPWWGDGRVTTVDLDLDVVRRRDGTIGLLDEDEFEENRVALGYPLDVVIEARRTADRLLDLVAREGDAYVEMSDGWLALLNGDG